MSAGTHRPSQQQVDLLLRRLKEVAPGFDNDFLIDILEQSGWDINRAIDEAIFMCVGAEGSLRPGLQPSNASVIAQNAISRGFISPSIQYAAAAPRVQKTELQQIQEAHQHIVSQLRQTPSSGGLRRIDPSEDPHTVFEQLRKGLPASPAPQQDRLFQQYASQAHRAEAPRVSPEEAQERFAREKRAAEEREQAARAAARAAEEQTAQRVSELTRLLEIQKRESEVEKQRVQLLEQQIAVQRAEQEAKLRELALIEEEQRRAQLERQRETLAVESVIAKEQPAELVIIYYNSEATESEKADIDVIRGIFQAERVPSNQIAVRDYTGDAALTATIRQHSVTATRTHASPMVYIRNNPVGNLEDCRKLIADQQHHVLLATTDTPPLPSDSDHSLSLAFGSSVLNAGSVTVRAVGSALWAPVTALKWLIGSTDPQLEEGVSFDVVRSNQWSREQHRIIRFTDTKILRIDPSNNTVREEATYDEVAGVISVDANNIIIRYKDETKHYPDYLRAMRVDIIRMKVLFNEKSQGRIRIFDPTEPLAV